MRLQIKYLPFVLLLISIWSCKNKTKNAAEKHVAGPVIYKGLYSFGPEVKSFKDCKSGQEFWAADSSAQLELKYSQLGFEKPDVPVYIEVEGKIVKPDKDSPEAAYNNVLIVEKLIKITKDIPASCE